MKQNKYDAIFGGKKALVVLSGGLDSTVALALARKFAKEVAAVSFFYGQKHRRELQAAKEICAHYELPTPHIMVDVSTSLSLGGVNSSLVSSSVAVPSGLYDEANMASTVVPGRNLIFLSVAASIAEGRGYDVVVTGVHSGDHVVYLDCRPEFIDAATEVIKFSTGGKVEVYAPFTLMKKSDIASMGASLSAPLDLTWSCYKGGAVHCGICGTCTERIEAFQNAGILDPTAYDPAGLDKAFKLLHEAGKLT